MYIEVDKGPDKNGLQARFGPRAAIWEGLFYGIIFFIRTHSHYAL